MTSSWIDAEPEEIMNRISQSLSPESKQYFVRFWKENIGRLITSQKTRKITLTLVLDTNSLLAELISFTRTDKSFLYSLLGNPFVKIYVPQVLFQEVEAHLDSVAKKKKLDISQTRLNWNQLQDCLEVSRPQDDIAWIKAMKAIGSRDITDVPFVALGISIEADGIISRDKDFEDQDLVRIWSMGDVGRVVTILEKGSFSFFLVAGAFPSLTVLLTIASAGFFSAVIEFGTVLVKALTLLVTKGIEAIVRIPDWLLILLGVLVLVVLLYPTTQNFVVNTINRTIESLIQVFGWLTDFLANIINSIKNILPKVAAILVYFVDNISETVHQLESIR